jgi:hypothetical protein
VYGIVRRGTEEASRYPDGVSLMPDLVFLSLLLVLVVVRIGDSQSDLPPVVVEVEYKDRARSNPGPDPVRSARVVLGLGVCRVGGFDPGPDADLCLDRVRKRSQRRAGNRTVYVSPSLTRRTIFDSGQAVQVDSVAALRIGLEFDSEATADTEFAVAVDDDRLHLVAAQLDRGQDDYQYHLTGNGQALLLSKWGAIERMW